MGGRNDPPQSGGDLGSIRRGEEWGTTAQPREAWKARSPLNPDLDLL